MRDRYIAPAIMLVAGAITSILNIVNNIEFLKGLERLLAVLVIFYIIGRVAAMVIKKATNIKSESAGIEEEDEHKDEDEDEDVKEPVTEEAAEENNQ